MSDEDALLAAIAACPDEDTPRLAYADWLDEHDRHIQAEFIRVQIEISHKETLPRKIQNRYVDVWKRNQELIDHHREELLGPLATLPADTRIEFRRGFIEEVQLRVDTFYRHRDAIAAVQPLPRLVLIASVMEVVELLGHVEETDRNRLVDLASAIRIHHRGEEDYHHPVAFYHNALRWARLTELDLSGCNLGDDDTSALLPAETFPVLTDLDLSGNNLSDAFIAPLLRSRLPRQLRRLILGGNPLTDQAALELAEGWPTGDDDRLKELNLKFTHIGPPSHQVLTARFGGKLVLF